jgi:hypothetical protein
LGRWHARLYFPALVLVLIAAVAIASHDREWVRSNRLRIAGIAILLLLANVYFVKVYGGVSNPWFGSIADNMEVQWYRNVPEAYWFAMAAMAVLVVRFAVRGAISGRAVTVALIAYAVISNLGTAREARFLRPSEGRCGQIVARYLSAAPGTLAVVAESRPSKVEVVFWLPVAPVRTLYATSLSAAETREVASRVRYVAVNGLSRVATEGLKEVFSVGQCRLYEDSRQ